MLIHIYKHLYISLYIDIYLYRYCIHIYLSFRDRAEAEMHWNAPLHIFYSFYGYQMIYVKRCYRELSLKLFQYKIACMQLLEK